jgi:hypothetical protein
MERKQKCVEIDASHFVETEEMPGGGAGRLLPGATSALLPKGSSTTYEDQSKPLVRSV